MVSVRKEAVERLFPGVVEEVVERWLKTYETYTVAISDYVVTIPSIARSITRVVTMPFTSRDVTIAVSLPEDKFILPPGEHEISAAHGEYGNVKITVKTDKYVSVEPTTIWSNELDKALRNRLVLERFA
ncbi:MAG: hypothetical protein ABWU84_11545 [Pyrobaculum sp.]|uniref:hypothetical protein n=1 Tax=Pyrobaculum sp. TaxID=2004705 RepID=UPI003EE984A7